MNANPWGAWKSGKSSGESNDWTEYKDANPVKASDVSDSGIDPLGAIAAGALSTILGQGIGAAISAAFADGGLVKAIHGVKPKTERQAKTLRQTRQKHADFKSGLKFAEGGAVNVDEQVANDLLAMCALARQVSRIIDPSQANDPEAIQSTAAFLLEYSDEEERQGWIVDFLDSFDPTGSGLGVLNQLIATAEFNHGTTDEAAMANGGKVGVKLAGGGFLGGNLGIALGAGADEWNRQRVLAMQQGRYDTEQKLAKPELETIDEATAARRSTLKAKEAENQANLSTMDDRTTNARLKLVNDNADMVSQAYGRLGQYKEDAQGGLDYLNKANLPQLNGGTATGLAFDHKGANVTLSDGRTVQIPQASIDRGAQSLNGGYEFMTNRVTGDIVRTNAKTGDAQPIVRADGSVNRPLTLAQDTANKQIDISRQRIKDMSPDEIRLKTAKATDTGRPNEQYDSTLAQHVRLANKRKYGTDDWYDQQGTTQANTQPTVSQRFGSDPAMRGNKMGNQTSKGIEVLDSNGKLIGFYK